jgi:hypothetical protein
MLSFTNLSAQMMSIELNLSPAICGCERWSSRKFQIKNEDSYSPKRRGGRHWNWWRVNVTSLAERARQAEASETRETGRSKKQYHLKSAQPVSTDTTEEHAANLAGV